VFIKIRTQYWYTLRAAFVNTAFSYLKPILLDFFYLEKNCFSHNTLGMCQSLRGSTPPLVVII